MKRKIDWQKEIRKIRIKNFADVRNELSQKWLLEKLEKEEERTNIPKEFIITQLVDYNILAITKYAKDPNKQNIHESILYDYLLRDFNERGIKITDFSILPKGKGGKLITHDGIIINYDSKVKKTNKTLDIHFVYDGVDFYGSHKFTDESGGAQDNQFNDLKTFCESARNSRNNKNYFIAIIDGRYYTAKKRDELLDLCVPKYNTVLFSHEVSDFLLTNWPIIKKQRG
ncbi:hypothetical protein ACNQ2O_01790 [Mycoplasma sp. AA7A]|uniref:hypothetical protein n=1 Tax=Mycoplasma sp. AA7A TaxID=3401665 RepID=UPI003AB0C5A3